MPWRVRHSRALVTAGAVAWSMSATHRGRTSSGRPRLTAESHLRLAVPRRSGTASKTAGSTAGAVKKDAAGEEAVGAWGAVRSGRDGQAESVESAELETGVRWVCIAGGPLGCPGGGDTRERKALLRRRTQGWPARGPAEVAGDWRDEHGAAGLRGVRRTGLRRLGLSPLRVRQRRLALSAHAHSTLAKGAHHHRAGLGRKSRHGCEHSGSAAAGATRLVGSVTSPRRETCTRAGSVTHSHISTD